MKVIICGAGQVGWQIARHLANEANDVTVVDSNPELVRRATEARGFAETRLLTHWEEIVGVDIAKIARPVSVKYGKGQFGATLTLLTTGANAPILKMEEEHIRARVNACYGYNAIGRMRITQTAPTGFAEGQVEFAPQPKAKQDSNPAIQARARQETSDVSDPGLRAALERLGTNVISKRNST